MARRLTDIKIHEVSSVDKGAGEGVKVLLMKRHEDEPVLDMRGLLKSKTPQESQMTDAELQALIAKAVGEVVKPMQDRLAKADAELLVLKMSADEKDYCDAEKMSDEQRSAFAAMKPEERAAKMKKLDDTDPVAKAIAPIQGENAELRKQNQDMAKRLASLELDKQKDTFAKRAVRLGLTEADGETMRKAYGGDPDAQVAFDKRIGEVTKAAAELAKVAKVFGEFGHTGSQSADGSEPINKLWAKADELRKADPKLSRDQAFAKVQEDPANADLWRAARLAEQQVAKVA